MNRLVSRIVVSLILVSLAGSVQAKKAKPFVWDSITDADWAVAEDSVLKVNNAVMIFEKISGDDEKLDHEKCYRTIYRRIRILTDEGRSYGDVTAPTLSASQKIESIHARTILPDGSEIVLLPEHIFEEQLVKYKGKKVKQKRFSIPGVSEDCIVEYAIKYRLKYPVSEWVVQKDIPLLRGELIWHLAAFRMTETIADMLGAYITPNYLWLNTETAPSITQLPNLKAPESLLFVLTDIPAFETEPVSVPDAFSRIKLITYYGSNEPPAAYWGEQSTSIDIAMERYSKKNKRVKKVLPQFANLTTDIEKIEAAYHWVQDSLINLSYEEFAPKKKKKSPRDRKSVNDVIKLGYGSAKELSIVFCDMLREMNIDARIAYAKSRTDDLFVARAKYWQFDHTLVAIPDNTGGWDFYCPGYPCAGPGKLPWYLQGVMALVGSTDDYLMPIPFAPSSDNLENWLYTYVVDDDLEVTGEFSARLFGQNAMSIRMAVFDEDSTEYDDFVLEEFEEAFPNAEMKILSFENLHDLEAPFSVSGELVPSALEPVAGRILLRPFDWFIELNNPFVLTERRHPVLFAHTIELRETAQIKLPDGWSVEATPADTSFENVAGQCAVSMTAFGSTISIQRVFILYGPYWTVDRYPIIRELYQARQEISRRMLVLKRSDQPTGSIE